MIDPAKPFSSRPARSTPSPSAVKADLNGLLDRARDERFRLLKMLKDARAEVAVTVDKQKPAKPAASATVAPAAVTAPPVEQPAAAPQPATLNAPAAEKLQALVTKLSALDAQLDAKLHRVNKITEEKLARLEAIDTRVGKLAQQLGHALADGRMIEKNIASAIDQARELPNTITQQLERFDDHIEAYQTLGAQNFNDHLDELKQAVIKEATAELGKQRIAMDTELAHAQSVLERELTAKFDQLANTLHEKADGILSRTENTANAAMDRVRKQVVQAMARAHDTQEAFASKLNEHRASHREYLDSLTDNAEGEFQVQAQRLDETMAGLAELFDSQADQILSELRDRATALLDQMSDTVTKLQDTQANAAAADDKLDQGDQRRAA